MIDNLIKFKYSDLNEVRNIIKNSFDQNGFIHIDDVFPIALCNKAKSVLVDYEKQLLENKNEIGLVTEKIGEEIKVKYFQGLYAFNPIFRKFYSSRLIEIAKILIGKDDLYFNDMETHIRNPGGGSIPKHQDNFYFNLKNALGLTCYIALNQHNSETGGLNYIANSHIKRVISHDVSDEAGFSSFIKEDSIEKKNYKKNLYKPDYFAGSVTLHHPENIHFAHKTNIESPRAFALSVRIFSSSEEIDEKGIERYKKNLEKNRD